MSKRDERQDEFSKLFLQLRKNGILYLCPRFGKCRVAINVFKAVDDAKILITYPDVKIKDAWTAEFKELEYDGSNVVFSTHRSLEKIDEFFDLVVVDEVHLLSPRQKIALIKLMNKPGCRVMGLTGTMSKWTKTELKNMGLPILAEYSLSTAVDEGVVTDYEIRVLTVPLDNTVRQYKNDTRTEKAQHDALTFVIKKLEEEGKDTMFLRMNRMRVIQKSIAKVEATRKMLLERPNDRILVFCGVTDIADNLGCPSYHSKSTEKAIFEDFATGKGSHLAVVKIGNTGVTYKPLNCVIVNYFDSNTENLAQKILRCMAMEYNNPEKKAVIYILSSDEEVELKWLEKALQFFDPKKVIYL